MNELWLSVDLSMGTGSVALHNGATSIVAEAEFEAMRSSEQVLTRLDGMFRQTGTDIGDLTRLITGSGPGSFTGLRIAYATLKGFALTRRLAIDTLNGSEARARAWSLENPGILKPGEAGFVLTPIAAGSLAVFRFLIEADGDWRFEESVEARPWTAPERSVLLLDGNLKPEDFPANRNFVFPLRARHLARTVDTARTKQTSQTLEDQTALVPHYFGTARFATSAADATAKR